MQTFEAHRLIAFLMASTRTPTWREVHHVVLVINHDEEDTYNSNG